MVNVYGHLFDSQLDTKSYRYNKENIVRIRTILFLKIK